MFDFLRTNVQTIIEIAVISGVIFLILRFLAGTRGFGILRGFLLLLAVVTLGLSLVNSFIVELPRIQFLLRQLVGASLIAVLVIFQPELRRGLIRLGERPLWRTLLTSRSSVVEEIVEAVRAMARNRIGALIALQRSVGLGAIIEGGTPMDSDVTSELLQAVFWPGSPLHDGAVVVQDQRIAAAGCLLPLSDNPAFGSKHGTRHRAAIGLTEETDAVCLVVSEESGRISFCFDGRIREDLPIEEVKKILTEFAAEKSQEE